LEIWWNCGTNFKSICLYGTGCQKPSPQEANVNLDTAVDGTSSETQMEERRSIRVRQASVMQDREGDLNEKKLALQKSCASHIGNLTKVHDEIVHLMESGASAEDLSRKRMKFDEAWCKFVDAHESYLELLDSPTDALVLEKAQAIYNEKLNESSTWISTCDYGTRTENPNGENIIVCFLAKRKGADVVGFPDRVQDCQRCRERRKSWL